MRTRRAIAAWFVLLGYAPNGLLHEVAAHGRVSDGELIVASSRLHARVAQAAVRDPSPPHELTPHGNDRSYLYAYDALPVEALTWPQLEEREFVYGPEYVDEFVAVYDSTFEAGGPGSGEFDLPVFVLQDANYNVVALLSPDADPGDGVAVAPDGLVLAQFVWEPYGALAAVDRAQIAPGVCVGPVYTFGHQGLFFERFATEPGAHAGSTTLTPGAIGLYYNRNRWYSPQLGRFLTRDPNETAMPIVAAVVSDGQTMMILAGAIDALFHYGSGINLYGYAGSNPLKMGNPLGLDDDPFAEVDDWYNELVGHRIGTLGAIVDGAYLGLRFSVNILSGFLPGAGLVEAYKAGIGLFNGEGGFWDFVAFGVAAAPIFGPIVYKAFQWGRSINKAGRVNMRANSVSLRVLQKLCFVAGTLVLMEDGSLKAIETLRVGDDVASWPDPQASTTRVAVDPASWRLFHRDIEGVNCTNSRITLLRPQQWLGVAEPCEGALIRLNAPELGLDGLATITAIDRCPPELSGLDTGFVSGTVTREASATLFIYLEAVAYPIQTTAAHRFWSVDRRTWIPAADLSINENLRTLTGTATIRAIVERHSKQTVYNFEVWGDHTYFVSEGNVWVHNTYLPVNQVNKLINKGKAPKSIKRADTGKVLHEKDHIHFTDGHAPNVDGTWKHGGRALTAREADFIRSIKWTVPGK